MTFRVKCSSARTFFASYALYSAYPHAVAQWLLMMFHGERSSVRPLLVSHTFYDACSGYPFKRCGAMAADEFLW